jgi:hypothetical protein
LRLARLSPISITMPIIMGGGWLRATVSGSGKQQTMSARRSHPPLNGGGFFVGPHLWGRANIR